MTGSQGVGDLAAREWLREVPFAHRGLHGGGVVENTLPSFEAAAAAGYGVELDVQVSADGVPVVFHDLSLRRLTGRDGAVARLTVSELAQLRLLEGEAGVPTLAEALSALRGTPVMLELKALRPRPGPLEPVVAALLCDHPGPVCVASFNPASLRWFRAERPHLPRVLTAMSPRGWGMRARFLRRLAQLRDAPSVAPVAVSFALDGLPHPAVDRWRDDGGTLIAWTVDSDSALRRARRLADNVIFERIRPALPGR